MNNQGRPPNKRCCFAVCKCDWQGRLDAQFYLPEHRELERRMDASGYPVHTVGSAAISTQVVDGPFGSDLRVEEYVTEGVPLIRVSNCRTGTVEVNEELVYITPEKHEQLIRSEVLPGDVLLTKAGHILGYAAVFPVGLERGNITSHLAAIRPAKGVDARFLAEFLSGDIGIQQIYRWGNKSTRPELNTDEVRCLKVVLPPPPIQRRLVAEMDAARAVRRAKLEQADALLAGMDAFVLQMLELPRPTPDSRKVFAVQSRMLEGTRVDAHFFQPHFIAIEAKIRNMPTGVLPLSQLLAKPPLNGVDARDYTAEGRRYLRVQNVRPFELETSEVAHVSKQTEKDVELQHGDILLTRKGTFGTAATVQDECLDCLISSEIILLCPLADSPVRPDFLVAWLNCSVMQALFDRHKTGAIMGHITQDVVATLPVPTPSPDIQQKIIAESQRRRTEARKLRQDADTTWQEAKAKFDSALLDK